MIHLACTRGNLGHWDYYSTVMKVKDIVENRRVITVAESEELFTDNINKILQREIKQSRIKAISTYFLNNEERFIGSIVLAIHRGAPKWTEIGITRNFEIEGTNIDDEGLNLLNSKFGVLTLSGSEQIFALDGQHRLLGLRRAYSEDNEIGELDIPVVFAIHDHQNLQRTRRLFTVLNKYAEKPRGAELIILDEDDASALIARKLVSDHEVLSKPNGISESKNGSIPNNDNKSLTTLVTINAINKILFTKPKVYYATRPSEDEIQELYEKAKLFWDTLFECFPELIDYINEVEEVKINELPIYRKHETGGSLLLRPVGQKLIAKAYSNFDINDLLDFKEKIKKVKFNLSSDIWKYLFWNEKMLTGEDKLKKNVLLYMLGKYDNDSDIQSEMSRVYQLNNQEYLSQISPVE